MKNKEKFLTKLILSFCLVMLIFFTKEISISFAATLAGGEMSGEIVLTEDTNLTAAIQTKSGNNLVIDLNGHVLKSSNGDRILIVGADTTVTIKDSNPNNSHYGTITDGLWVYNSSATSGTEIKGGIMTGSTTCDRGGAVFCTGTLILEGGTFAGCKAIPNANANENNETDYPVNTFTNGTGGAIYINEPGIFEMNGGAIKYCKSTIGNSIETSKGGAVFIDSNNGKSSRFVMNGGTISNCQAMLGGGVFVHSNIYGNNTVVSGASFEMTGGEILNCYASGTGQTSGGGGIFINATESTSTSVASISSFYMAGGEIKLNTTEGMGGGIYSLGDFTMSGSSKISENTTKNTGTIENNKEVYTGFGGGVFLMKDTSNFVMNGGTISDCVAASAGGVMVYTSASFTMNGGIISSCKSQGTGGTGNGGAVYVQAATFNFNNGTLEDCSATRYGGAININQTAKLSLNGNCNIINNTAAHGGGISQEAGNCQIKLDNENILIKGNKATGNGGGLFIEKGTLDISACTIENNQAGNNGGGIALRVSRIGGDITVNMGGGIIRNNTATVDGGGIDIYADYTFVEDDESEDANRKNDVVVNITNGIVNGNAVTGNGGGVHIYVNEDNGTAVMNVSDAGNSCGTEINENISTGDGGGICVSGGNFNISSGIINKCTAKNGGAVYVSGGNVNINGGTISNSQATSGAGIFIADGNITMNGGTISNNQAKEYGGGIYAASDSTDLTLSITSGSIIGNIASKNGGGVGVNMGTGLTGNVTVGLESCNGLNETHSHPIISDNTANEYGGGFWLNGDSMTMNMYCGSIEKNLAVLEAGSSNIYQTGGNAVVHAGSVGEGVIVIGGEYIYIPDNQLPKVQITYDSNNSDNSEQSIALVTEGVEIYLPKNLFTREGYILYGWSYSQNPSLEEEIMLSGTPYQVNEEAIIYAVWKIEGQGKVQTPIINSNKCYDEIIGGSNIMITKNSCFTTQMSVLEVQPNYYTNRTLIFDKNLINGTKITMIDCSYYNEKRYYHYKVNNDTTKNIPLSEFIKNGSDEKYSDSISEEEIDEIFMFVVELPENNTMTGVVEMTLKRAAVDTTIAPIEQSVAYTMTEKRSFNLSYENDSGILEEPTIENTLTISYEKGTPVGYDSRYNGKELALIVKSGEVIPEDVKIFDGTNTYMQNGNNQFIIPIGDIDENKEINLKLILDALSKNEIGLNLKCELYVAEDMNKPCMGEKVAEIENINLEAIDLPAMKANVNKKALSKEEFTGNVKLNYESLKLDEKNVTLEIQKKLEDSSYKTQIEVLESVAGNSENTDGVFNLELNSSGSIDLDFVDGFESQLGTYRILLKVLDGSDTILEMPCNFMVTK